MASIARQSREGGPEEAVLAGYRALQRHGLLKVTFDSRAVWQILESAEVKPGSSRDCSSMVMELLVGGGELEEELLQLAGREDRHGRGLLLRYRKALAPLLVPNAKKLLEMTIALPVKKPFLRLSELLLRLARESEGESGGVAATVTSATVRHWQELAEGGRGEAWVLQLVRHLALLPSLHHPGAEVVLAWWADLLASQALRLQVKYRLLSLLPGCWLARLAEDREDRLKSALLSLASQHFPAKSGELCEGSLELTEYTAVWRLLLRSLVASGSPPVFYLLLSVACREAEHLLEAELQQAVVAAIEAAQPAGQQNLLQVNCVDDNVFFLVQRGKH